MNRRLYYSLVDGEVQWDAASWRQENEVAELSQAEQNRRQDLEVKFNDLFLSVTAPRAEEPQPDAATDAATAED